jgi:osmoprotectant transport system substrate-binding protein
MRRLNILAVALLASAILAGCDLGSSSSSGSSTGGSSTCPTSGSASSTGSGSLKVGMKGFAEEQLLASMTKLMLEKRGFTVDATFTAKDPTLGQALESGQIDMYWQYTGTELQGPLGVDKPPTDLQQAFDQAKSKDEARGICWNAQANFNDTNGLAIKSSDKSKYGSNLTDLAKYLKDNPKTVVCIESEFRTRADGVPGLKATYGIDDALPGYKDIGGNTAEKQIASGQCEVGEVFTTDSGIAANNLYVLQDDKKLFPPDNVGLLIKSSVQKAHPEIGAIMAPVAQKLTTDEMTGLNKKVEIDRASQDPLQASMAVAKDFLTQNGFL